MTAIPLPRPEHPREPRPSRAERAHDAGFDPVRDGIPLQPTRLDPNSTDPWDVALAASRAQVLAWGLTACRHPHCRNSLSEWDVTYCPHDLPFCEDCTWEDGGCDECAVLAGGLE